MVDEVWFVDDDDVLSTNRYPLRCRVGVVLKANDEGIDAARVDRVKGLLDDHDFVKLDGLDGRRDLATSIRGVARSQVGTRASYNSTIEDGCPSS